MAAADAGVFENALLLLGDSAAIDIPAAAEAPAAANTAGVALVLADVCIENGGCACGLRRGEEKEAGFGGPIGEGVRGAGTGRGRGTEFWFSDGAAAAAVAAAGELRRARSSSSEEATTADIFVSFELT